MDNGFITMNIPKDLWRKFLLIQDMYLTMNWICGDCHLLKKRLLNLDIYILLYTLNY